MITDMAHTVYCASGGTLPSRKFATLLLGIDRVAGNELEMTQQFIGNMLGLRREEVADAAGKLAIRN